MPNNHIYDFKKWYAIFISPIYSEYEPWRMEGFAIRLYQFITFYNHVRCLYMQLCKSDIVRLHCLVLYYHSFIPADSTEMIRSAPEVGVYVFFLILTSIIIFSTLCALCAHIHFYIEYGSRLSRFSLFAVFSVCAIFLEDDVTGCLLQNRKNHTESVCSSSNVWLKEVNMLFIKQFVCCVWCYNIVGIVLDAY